MRFVVVLALITLCGCGPSRRHVQQPTVLCDLKGQAWFARPNVGDNSFVSREPDMDMLCRKEQTP